MDKKAWLVLLAVAGWGWCAALGDNASDGRGLVRAVYAAAAGEAAGLEEIKEAAPPYWSDTTPLEKPAPKPEPMPDWRLCLAGKRPVRLGLASRVSEIELICEGTFKIFTASGLYRSGEAGERVTIFGRMREPVTFVPAQNKSWSIKVDGRPLGGTYAGEMEVFSSPGVAPQEKKLTLVNRISLESYIAGVVEREMPANFCLEALRAQAIAARSYTLCHLTRHAAEGFDLCGGTHCHVYRGVANPYGRPAAATLSTRGQVVVFRGEPVRTFYHSTCGGETADGLFLAEDTTARPYLVGISDTNAPGAKVSGEGRTRALLAESHSAYCRYSTKYRWSVSLRAEAVEKMIRANLGTVIGRPGLDPGKLKSIDAALWSEARVRALKIDTESGVYYVEGNPIRWLFRSEENPGSHIRSTLFVLSVKRNAAGQPQEYEFTGGGWGHGVGMCQWGAEGRARAGAGAEEIMRAYFPGTEIWHEKLFEKNEESHE